MTTAKQKKAAKENIRKAQAKWQSMSKRQRSLAQPEGRKRKKPGSTGEGDYFHIQIRPKTPFKTFRTQDVGEKGHIQRVAGKRSSGSWATVKWLISKEDAHIENGHLRADTKDAQDILNQLEAEPTHVKGDIFKAKQQKRA